MRLEYDALNALQKSAFRINSFVLDTIQALVDRDIYIGKIPAVRPIEVPAFPYGADFDTSKATEEESMRIKDWKRMASSIHSQNAKQMSRRIQFVRTLSIAEQFKKEDSLWFVWQNDFRGRKYPTTSFLSPQSSSYAKALLEFADALPVENEEQLNHMLHHGANCFGLDKIAIEDRVLAMWMRADEVKAIARDPIGNLDLWGYTDDPWGYLAFCEQFAGFLEEGYGYKSRLITYFDGSTNGLQHFSAALRDPVGGLATNLIPGERPQDLYQRVANRVIERMKAELPDTIAQQWLDFGLDRSGCKRQVMTMPYGSTSYSCRDYTQQYIIDRMEKGHEVPDAWRNDIFTPTTYGSNHIWESIGEIVTGAREAMDWIRQCARKVARENLPLIWTSPSGFIVHQHYPETKSRRINTTIDNTLVKPSIREEDWSRVDVNRMVNGSAPNLVHSLDAAAMTFTILKCKDLGIRDFAMVHDSYGTHAHHAPALNAMLREAFVEMYLSCDPLDDFRNACRTSVKDLPPAPKKGDLDITGVLDSKYFFA